eukprot:7212890-Prymnesium_polylepis.1
MVSGSRIAVGWRASGINRAIRSLLTLATRSCGSTWMSAKTWRRRSTPVEAAPLTIAPRPRLCSSSQPPRSPLPSLLSRRPGVWQRRLPPQFVHNGVPDHQVQAGALYVFNNPSQTKYFYSSRMSHLKKCHADDPIAERLIK